MSVAGIHCDHAHIYFPHNLDRRGRVYPVVDFLSPQGNDLQRGLLEFAKGDRMTGDADRWLRVHLANCYGVDKVSFEERVKWADDNVTAILESARAPLDTDWWHGADQPWQFLAACFAWADYRANGEASVCRIPVMLDGSCSAFQHYAAALRDEQVAPLVNLLPQEQPGDLYAAVTAQVTERIAGDAALRVWKGKVDRSTVKRAVMVEPYGASHLSKLRYIQEQLEEDGDQEAADEIAALFENTEAKRAALGALTSAIRAATVGGASRPLETMKWIRKLVRAWAKQAPHKAFGWTTPSKLPIVSPYYRTERNKVVEVKLEGEPIHLATRLPTDQIDWKKTATAAAPNFIHSLDASHLALSVVAAKRKSITQLCAVHDAFGTTPARTGTLLTILRREFAKLYSQDQFAPLTSAAQRAGVQFSAPLARGQLDPKLIAQATYLFA
jgi:DNA-directed RNA polymerase